MEKFSQNCFCFSKIEYSQDITLQPIAKENQKFKALVREDIAADNV
jgi:hypothetical protein